MRWTRTLSNSSSTESRLVTAGEGNAAVAAWTGAVGGPERRPPSASEREPTDRRRRHGFRQFDHQARTTRRDAPPRGPSAGRRPGELRRQYPWGTTPSSTAGRQNTQRQPSSGATWVRMLSSTWAL
jgi:hypothetical protein